MPNPPAGMASVLRSPWLLGLAAAGWSLLIGLGIALASFAVVWIASDTGLELAEAMRLGGLTWLVANGATVVIAGVSYSLLPWGLLLIPLLLLGYAGGWAVRRGRVDDLRGVALIVLPGTALYAIAGGVVSFATARSTTSIDPLGAVIACALVSLVALSFGAVRASGLHRMHGVPWLGPIARAAAVGVAAIVGAGAIAAAASLLLHLDDAITMAQSLHPGLWGGLGLLLIGIAYVPVAVVWGASYLVGAGVVLGPGVMVSPFIAAVSPTDLPPFPLLAAVPQSSSPMAWLLPVVGVLAGVLLGLSVLRAARPEPRLVRVLVAAVACAGAGLGLAVLAFLSAGGLGNGRLIQLGPSPVTVGVLAAVLLVLGAVPTVVVPGRRPRRSHLSVAEAAADPAPSSE